MAIPTAMHLQGFVNLQRELQAASVHCCLHATHRTRWKIVRRGRSWSCFAVSADAAAHGKRCPADAEQAVLDAFWRVCALVLPGLAYVCMVTTSDITMKCHCFCHDTGQRRVGSPAANRPHQLPGSARPIRCSSMQASQQCTEVWCLPGWTLTRLVTTTGVRLDPEVPLPGVGAASRLHDPQSLAEVRNIHWIAFTAWEACSITIIPQTAGDGQCAGTPVNAFAAGAACDAAAAAAAQPAGLKGGHRRVGHVHPRAGVRFNAPVFIQKAGCHGCSTVTARCMRRVIEWRDAAALHVLPMLDTDLMACACFAASCGPARTTSCGASYR